MTELTSPPTWDGPSRDPNDEQFGDSVEPTTLSDADAEKYDAVLVGEPTDRAVIGRKGAREGPPALRDELATTKTHHLTRGPVGRIGDLGDVEIPDGDKNNDSDREEVDAAAIQDAVREVTHDVHALDTRPVFLGGDNSLTYSNVHPLLTEGTVGVVSFDAHFDCRESDEPSSGTPYRQLFEDGLDAFAVVGARHFENSTVYAEYVDEQEGTVVTAEDIGKGLRAAVQTALDAMADVEQIYVSLDLDVLNASAAPGVSAPTPGGITTRELYRMLRIVGADDRVVGCEVVECAPPLDIDGRTATAGARAIAHVLSSWGNTTHHD
jgi:formimidoylglutamase